MYFFYAKNIWRGLLRQKMNSSIKIGGLALGIAACLLITLYIKDELGYDKHYPNGDRIFRVIGVYNINGDITQGAHFPAPLATALKEDFPEVDQVGRINANELFSAGSNEIRRSDVVQNTYDEGFAYADQKILDIFRIPMIYGDRSHALDEPNTIVISKSKAEQYFPNENPVGKTLILNNDPNKTYRIGGVMENFPENCHLKYDFLITLKGLEFWNGEQKTWMASNYYTYLMVHPGTNVAELEKKLSLITKKYFVPALKQGGNVYADKAEDMLTFKLQPVGDIHLRSEGIDDGLNHGDIRFIRIFAIIAGFILIIASINFINLSTSKSVSRAREVGLRKTIGATRKNLIRYFLTDSILFSFISFTLGTLLAYLFLPFFNLLSSKYVVFPWTEWGFLPLLAFAAIVVGILAGLYPSFYLSSFKPIHALKNNLNKTGKGTDTRSTLVVFQFAASIILILGTFMIYRQMEFILHKKVGFDKDQVVLIHGANTLNDQVYSLKNELLKLSDIKNVSISGYLPVSGTRRNGNSFWKEGKEKEEESVNAQIWNVDPDYIKTLGMKIVEGRDFSTDMATDVNSVIINKTLAKKLGLTNPIGKGITNYSGNILTVIGVVEDFHFESLRDNIGGLCLRLGESPNIVSVKVNTADMSGIIQSITKIWNGFSPNQPIRYTFLDENFAMMYADVKRMGHILSAFASLAIIIACLGLFALSSSMIDKRTKEIGIRKVNGARF